VTAQPLSGPGWAHELKHDGYRFTDPCLRWSSEALHDQRRRLVKALPADCRESGSRGSKLSVGAKWNEQTFICVQSNIHDPCGNTCRRSDHADRTITDSDDRLWCQEHTVHYDRDRARPHLDSEDGAIGGEYHAVGNYSNVSRTQGAQSRTAKTSATRLWHPIRGTRRGPWGQNVCCGLSAWPGGHRLKEARRAVQVRTIKGVAANQESESTGSNTRNRGNVLIQL